MANVTEAAADFVRQLVAGDVEDAHKALSDGLAAELSADTLREHFEALADDMGGVTGIGEPMVILEEWPDKTEADRAIVYVPLEGDSFSEAVTVTIAEQGGLLCISSIEWGRP